VSFGFDNESQKKSAMAGCAGPRYLNFHRSWETRRCFTF
jgi:hypothetical protein